MRIKETPLGGGLSRLEVEGHCAKTLPTEVVDMIMRDIIARKQRGEVPSMGCCTQRSASRFGWDARPSMPLNRPMFPQRRNDTPFRDTCREPDGIDIHVDRPRRELFCTHHEWAEAMAKYRTLEDVAKDCDWPAREPMRTIPQRPVREIRRVNIPDLAIQAFSCFVDENDDWDEPWIWD